MNKQISLLLLILAFYLGTCNGRLALWENGSDLPLEVFPYSSTIYTKIDQTQLKSGIFIWDKTEITRYLDDYLS